MLKLVESLIVRKEVLKDGLKYTKKKMKLKDITYCQFHIRLHNNKLIMRLDD